MARWLRVPAGTHTNPTPLAAATPATSAWEPSPPAIPITSAPPATACSASRRRSSPGASTTGSIPRRRASETRLKRSTLPPPDLGFISRTGRVAGPTGSPGVGLVFSDRMSRPRACLVAAAPVTISPTIAPSASRLRTAPTTNATDAARASTASTAARVRRRPVRVTA